LEELDFFRATQVWTKVDLAQQARFLKLGFLFRDEGFVGRSAAAPDAQAHIADPVALAQDPVGLDHYV